MIMKVSKQYQYSLLECITKDTTQRDIRMHNARQKFKDFQDYM